LSKRYPIQEASIQEASIQEASILDPRVQGGGDEWFERSDPHDQPKK
jgi:hypothetical protein